MNYPLRAVIAIALGAGLAAAAQAQDTYSQSAAPNSQSAAPAAKMQNAAPAARMHRTARLHKASAHAGKATSAHAGKVSRQEVRMAQQQLKSDGLYKGRIDGMMNHRMRLAVAHFQKQNGLPRTASLDRKTLDRLTTGQGQASQSGLGVGSSTPNNPNAMNSPNAAPTPMTPPTTPGKTGTGGTTAPSGAGGTTTPSNPASKY